MAAASIITALRAGPRTNAQIQDEVCDHSGGVARDCAKLIASGRVRRIDGGTGRGSIAVYALNEAI